MGDALCNGRINWLVLLIPLVYLVLAAVPLLCCPRAFGRGQGDVFARSVLVAVPLALFRLSRWHTLQAMPQSLHHCRWGPLLLLPPSYAHC